ncbi:glycosyltransferase family 2 protein [Pedobacter cryophilus]|uniref:Glycosyltransferase n=1 Tax=Pedobacter cryophilus TaxID=2571271 RepID=A0A4U1BYH7_9SPHI|nr:glycosyltransferase [Pedobacter cryophilus]TKB97629.1 glycosyltransferase [Pedobacter cryophilus]
MNNSEIMVSICCITYNHQKYIAQALDGFLMQETNFKYEIIIGEDCSKDNTRAIIEDYCQKYPNKIQLLTYESNIGGIKNQIETFNISKGKYVAMCDGDDYWTDPLKLQKQVDFMESNPNYVICCHYSRVIDDNSELIYENPSPISLEFDYEDVLLGKKDETRICSLMIKNNCGIKKICLENWYYNTFGADTFLKLYAMANTNEKIYVLPEVMAVYRLHKDGVYSLIDGRVRKSKMINDFNILINNFSYSAHYKKELLKIYITQYFLFDIRHYNFQKALNTIITLV